MAGEGCGKKRAAPISQLLGCKGKPMLENVKAVSNPLTIIAIFAALAEVAGTAALAALGPELQALFVWFVMGFPILLVVAFFLTLNFNPKVLYAPSDFKDEEHFLGLLAGSTRASVDLAEITKQLDRAREDILAEVGREKPQINEATSKKLSEIVEKQLHAVRKQLEATRAEFEEAATGAVYSQKTHSRVQATIVEFLQNTDQPFRSVMSVAKNVGMSYAATLRACQRLESRGIVKLDEDVSGEDIVTLDGGNLTSGNSGKIPGT